MEVYRQYAGGCRSLHGTSVTEHRAIYIRFTGAELPAGDTTSQSHPKTCLTNGPLPRVNADI